jgi:hypothetical protein
MHEWRKFFFLWLPLSFLGTAVVVEAAAFALNGITLHRHSVDDHAVAVLHDTRPYRVVLLGDSVTQNVAHRFRIGDVDEVADLSTHAKAGLPSSLFLLKRYLESGHHPQQVVFAGSPGVFTSPMERATFAYFVTTVFTLPYEREFLQKYYGDYASYAWKPAALSITTRIGEPLFSLIRRKGDENDIRVTPDAPSPHPVLENIPDYVYDESMLQSRLDIPSEIRPEVKAVVQEMCMLSRRYGFSLHFIWAPLHPKLRDGLISSGKLPRITEQLYAIAGESGTKITVDDSNDAQQYLYFDRELLHVRGLGWEQTYANQLDSYIHGFESAAN